MAIWAGTVVAGWERTTKDCAWQMKFKKTSKDLSVLHFCALLHHLSLFSLIAPPTIATYFSLLPFFFLPPNPTNFHSPLLINALLLFLYYSILHMPSTTQHNFSHIISSRGPFLSTQKISYHRKTLLLHCLTIIL